MQTTAEVCTDYTCSLQKLRQVLNFSAHTRLFSRPLNSPLISVIQQNTSLNSLLNLQVLLYSIHEPEVQCISKGKEHKKHKLFCKRAGIEPTIGHLKSDHRLGRNFYKGVVGNAVNLLLAAAAYNFKRAIRALLTLLKIISEILSESSSSNDFSLGNAF